MHVLMRAINTGERLMKANGKEHSASHAANDVRKMKQSLLSNNTPLLWVTVLIHSVLDWFEVDLTRPAS